MAQEPNHNNKNNKPEETKRKYSDCDVDYDVLVAALESDSSFEDNIVEEIKN